MISCVSIVKVQNSTVDTAVSRVVNLSGGLAEKIKRESTVLIKPNVCGAFASGSGLVTDARVIEAAINLIKEVKPYHIIIGEGSSVGYDVPDFQNTKKAFKKSGMEQIARRLGVELVDLNEDEQVEVRRPAAKVMKKFKKLLKTYIEIDSFFFTTYSHTGQILFFGANCQLNRSVWQQAQIGT